MQKGVVKFYFGEGNGKSQAAIGNSVKAASEGKSVVIIQFLKGKGDDEQVFENRLEPEIKFFRFSKSEKSFEELSESEKEEETMTLRNGFHYGRKVVATGGCELVVLDEVLALVDLGIVSVEEIKELLEARPEEMTVICTGRILTDELRELADEINNISSDK